MKMKKKKKKLDSGSIDSYCKIATMQETAAFKCGSLIYKQMQHKKLGMYQRQDFAKASAKALATNLI